MSDRPTTRATRRESLTVIAGVFLGGGVSYMASNVIPIPTVRGTPGMEDLMFAVAWWAFELAIGLACIVGAFLYWLLVARGMPDQAQGTAEGRRVPVRMFTIPFVMGIGLGLSFSGFAPLAMFFAMPSVFR